MSVAINSVLIGGNVTGDIELRQTPDGTSVTNFSVAINHGTRDEQKTEFVDVTAWHKTAELCAQYLSKGSPVVVEGRLHLESWEDRNGGGKRTKMTVVAARVNLLGGRQQGDQGQSARQPSRYNDDNRGYAGYRRNQPDYNY